MRSLTRGNIKLALSTVRATRWRSLFTVLGVIIGIVSVVTVVSIGEGIKQQISGQINRLGKDLLTIRPGTTSGGVTGELSLLATLSNIGSNTTLTNNDLTVVQNTPGVSMAVPMSVVPGAVQVHGQQFNSVVMIGTNQDVPSALNQQVQYGAFFGSGDMNEDVAVIGANLAQTLFGSPVPLGFPFSFRGQTFIVRGVMNQFDTPPLALDTDFNNAIFIPYPVAQSLNNGSAPIYEILVKPNNTGSTSSVASSIRTRLASAHGGQTDFSVLSQQQSLAAANNILALLETLIGAVAAISLIVGGIGIMNVMLVAVTERTHEIGIRKALGATNRQIRSQFLMEAVTLSVLGGLGGIVLSLLINVALRIFTNLAPALSWQVISLAVGVSLAVGIVFGIMPALKASRKNPIDALREG